MTLGLDLALVDGADLGFWLLHQLAHKHRTQKINPLPTCSRASIETDRHHIRRIGQYSGYSCSIS